MLMSSEFDDEEEEDEEEEEEVEEDEEEEEKDDDDEEPSSDISSDVAITIWMTEEVPRARFKAVWRSRTVFQRRNDMANQWCHGGSGVCTASRSIRLRIEL
jgi:ABC-type Zn2+ transport system substrate-binding protein/surface adhesin